MFGLDPIKMAKKELLKLDALGKKGVPDVLEALDAAEMGLDALADFVDDVDAEEAKAFLQVFNDLRKPEKKRSDDELTALAEQIAKVPAALRQGRQMLDTFEDELRNG